VEGPARTPARRSRPTGPLPRVRWAFTKGFLIGCVLEVPALSVGVWLLARFGIGDADAELLRILWLTTMFAGLAAVLTAGGIGRLAASVTAERGRRRAIYVAARAHAIAGAGLLVIATIPHGHLPLGHLGWFWIAVVGLIPGAICGAAIGWACSRVSPVGLSDVWSVASRPSAALRSLFDPRDLVKLGSALRTRTSTLFDGMFEPAARPPENKAKPAAPSTAESVASNETAETAASKETAETAASNETAESAASKETE